MSRVTNCADFVEMVVELLDERKQPARFKSELFCDAANITYQDRVHALGEMFFDELQDFLITAALGTLLSTKINMLLLKVWMANLAEVQEIPRAMRVGFAATGEPPYWFFLGAQSIVANTHTKWTRVLKVPVCGPGRIC